MLPLLFILKLSREEVVLFILFIITTKICEKCRYFPHQGQEVPFIAQARLIIVSGTTDITHFDAENISSFTHPQYELYHPPGSSIPPTPKTDRVGGSRGFLPRSSWGEMCYTKASSGRSKPMILCSTIDSVKGRVDIGLGLSEGFLLRLGSKFIYSEAPKY